MGRPRGQFNKKIAKEICLRIAGGETLSKICESDGMPCRQVVLGWIFRDENLRFAKQFEMAKKMQSESFTDDLINIADEVLPAKDLSAIKRNELRVETRKWIASKILPRQYGDKSFDIGPNLGVLLENLVGGAQARYRKKLKRANVGGEHTASNPPQIEGF